MDVEKVRAQKRAWRKANPDKVLAHQRAWRASHADQTREYDRRYRLADPGKALKRMQSWRAIHPERVREWHQKEYQRDAEKQRERARALKQADPEKVRAGQRNSARKWRQAHREIARRQENRRKTRKAGVLLTVEVQANHCGICQRPLTSLPYPDPLSTTVGHEPPLAIAARDGWLIISTRPEHWGCNMRKRDRMDVDL